MRKANASIDYTTKDYESFRAEMINDLQTKIPSYTDTSQTDVGIVLIELTAKGLDILSYNQDSNANETYLVTSEKWSSINNWCGMLGYTPTPASPSRFLQVFVLSAVQQSNVTIPKGTIVKTPSNSSEPSIFFETVYDLIIPAGKLGDEKDVYGLYNYTVEIVQGYSITDDNIGYSTGASDQKFTLSNGDVLVDDLIIKVYNGTVYETWSRVDSFIDSTADSLHYRVEQDENGYTTIIFGDNFTGKIPTTSVSPIYAYYRVGGGVKGNVTPNSISMLGKSSSYIKRTFNPYTPKVYGYDRESKDSIKLNAPAYARNKWGLIQAKDYEAFVSQNYSKQVYFSSAVTNATDPNIIEVLVLNKEPYTLNEVQTLLTDDLADRNLIRCSCSVLGPEYLTQNLTFSLIVLSNYTQSTVKTSVESYITNYFTLGKYPFGEELILSSLCAEITSNVEGVKSLRAISPTDDVITPTKRQIIVLGTLTVNATGGDA